MKMIPKYSKNLFINAIILISISCHFTLLGQNKIQVVQSSSVSRLMENFVHYGKANETIKAWRIQIITTDDRRLMESTLSKFNNMYPGVSSEWKHVTPYYQVRVGYYESKNRLMPFLLELKKIFPSATSVYDQVAKKSLVTY